MCNGPVFGAYIHYILEQPMRVTHSKAFLTVPLLGLFLAVSTSSSSVQPNYTKTTVYDVNATGDDIETKSFVDGLGRALQTQIRVSEDTALISAQEYDDAGRPSKSYKSFTHQTDLDYLSADEVPTKAEKAYRLVPGGENGYPYSETRYYNDPLSRVKAAGAPGSDYSNHPVNSWYLGTKKDPDSPTDHQDSRGFLNKTGLDILSGKVPGDLQLPASGTATHFLSVSMDPDGNFSQSMTTVFGNTVLTWADPNKDTEGDEIIAEYQYDILGNVLKEIPPKHGDQALLDNTTIEYNTLGQVVKRTSPDGGVTKYKYDESGRISSVLDANDLAINENYPPDLAYSYDDLGRVEQIVRRIPAEVSGLPFADAEMKVLRFYDDVSSMSQNERNSYGITDDVLNGLKNIRGRMFAQVSYGDMRKCNVVDLYGYNDEGQVDVQYKLIPGLSLQIFLYTYDDHGKPESVAWNGGSKTMIRRYEYESLGRLASMKDAQHNHLVSYDYDERGLLTKKTYFDGAGAKITSIGHVYNIRDWLHRVVELNSPSRYHEHLDYLGDSPSFRGNIQKATHRYGNAELEHDYEYDQVNRLTNTGSVASDDEGSIRSADYDEHFVYDAIGRFEQKRTGANADDKVYDYYGSTNRLRQVAGQPQNNYLYDANGNVIVDMQKRCRIEYDYRNLPIRFEFYASMPSLAPNNRGEIPGDLDAQFANHDRVSEVIMVYDAGGSRVLKAERTDFGKVAVYNETFNGIKSLFNRGFVEGSPFPSSHGRWDLNTTDGTLHTTDNAGGWQEMARIRCDQFSVARSEGPITAEWSVRFPTNNSGPGWREQNKVWFSILDENKESAYTLRFKPNRRQDLQTSPDMKLYKGAPFIGLQEVRTSKLTPSGNEALWVKFKMVIHPEGEIKVFYDCRDGNGMKEYISVENSDFATFGGIQIEYKTGDRGTSEHYYIEVDDIRILRPGEPATVEEFLAMSKRATAYVNGFAVYEQTAPGAGLELAYTNITTSVGGVEGRVEYSENGETRYFYLKDHLGSNRVVIFEEDGASGVIEAVAYTAYGEMRDVTTVTGSKGEAREKFTGKEFDEEGAVDGVTDGISAYHFGARTYDSEVGVFMSADRARQFFNSYSYCGGNPIAMVDVDGNVAIFVNGVNGNDDPEFRNYLAQSNPFFGGTEYNGQQAAFHGSNYGFLRKLGANDTWNQIGDLAIAASGNGVFYAAKLQVDYERAYRESIKRGEPFYVVNHSGGAQSGGVATGLFNISHGYGTVTHQYNVNGADVAWVGTSAAELTGTQVTSYYQPTDVVSAFGASWDLTNPVTLAIDPGKNLQTLDPFHWGTGDLNSNTAFGHNGDGMQFFDLENTFTGNSTGSKLLQGGGIYGALTGDFTFAAGLLSYHYGVKILREVTWYANPINWFRDKD